MRRHIGDKLWVQIQLAGASLLWGLIVAVITAQIVRPLPDWWRGLIGVIIFVLGFTALEITVKKYSPDEIESSRCIECGIEIAENDEFCVSCFREYLRIREREEERSHE